MENRNELAKKYVPLVKKISIQMSKQCSMEYDDIEGFAWEGFVMAMNKYNPERSDMSFTSYASYGIRNAILNGINSCSNTVAVSYYKRKQMQASGDIIPTSVSLQKNFENEDHLSQLGFEEEHIFDNPWDVLIKKLKAHFNAEWVDIFCSIYGLDGHDLEKSKDIAARYGVSGSLITKRAKQMIQFIKDDKDLCELLRELL